MAETGDMAADFGIVAFGHDSNAWVHVMETAKYVVVWKKLNGSWKALYNCCKWTGTCDPLWFLCLGIVNLGHRRRDSDCYEPAVNCVWRLS